MRVSEAFHNGGGARGKSVSIESDLHTPGPRPFGQRRVSLAKWLTAEKARCALANTKEVLERLAMGHLVFLLQITPIGVPPALAFPCPPPPPPLAISPPMPPHPLLGNQLISEVSTERRVATVKHSGLEQLLPHYDAAWTRLLAAGGLTSLIPAAAVKVTPTRWDLANLLLVQATRGARPLMSIVSPNAGAVANGMLGDELRGGTEVAHWETPLRVLAANRAVLGEPPPPPPPISFPDPTRAPSIALTAAAALALRTWCTRFLWNKRQDHADRSGPNQTLQQTRKKRKRRPRRRLLYDSSQDGCSESEHSESDSESEHSES